MNRVINLKKPTTPVAQPVSSPATAQSPPPIRHSPLSPARPSPKPQPMASHVQAAPAQASTSAFGWRFSLGSEPRTLWRVVGALIGGAVLLAFFHYYALAVILVLSGIVLVLHNKPGASHEIVLSDLGIRIDAKMYFYKEMKSFWISYTPGGIQELSVQLRGWYLPYLSVPLGGKDPVRIREILITYIPEKEHPSSLVSLLLRRIGL